MLLSCSENKVVPCSGELEIGILSPIDGSSYTQGEDFQLIALVVDPCRRSLENSNYTVFSDKNQQLDGEYALDEDSDIWSFSSTNELSVGTHQILLRVVNSQGMSGDDAITLNIIENESPTVILSSPLGEGFEGEVLISGLVEDQEQSPSSIELSWMINGEIWYEGANFPDENGEFSFTSSFESGCYDIQVTATDSFGKQDQDTGEFVTWSNTDEISHMTWYLDIDGDGFGSPEEENILYSCEQPDGYTSSMDAIDCAPLDPQIYPGAPDYCNDGIDSDCSPSTPSICYPLGIQDVESSGVVITGDLGSSFGQAITSVGDWTGDGYDDFLVGSHYTSEVFVFKGPLAGDLSTSSNEVIACTLTNNSNQSYLGETVLWGEDINGDGYKDILIGSRRWGENTFPNPGAIYILFGDESGGICDGEVNLDEQEFSYSTGGVLRLLGTEHNDQIGESFAWIPDIDSDGLVELAIGSYGDDENGTETGAVYVLYSSNLVLGEENASIEELAHVKIKGQDDYEQLGRTVQGGDFDGDGVGDILIGTPTYNRDGTNQGRVQIAYGIFFPIQKATYSSPAIVDTTIYGDNPNDQFGVFLDTMKDQDGDGDEEIIIAAKGANENNGHVYVFPGLYSNGLEFYASEEIDSNLSPLIRQALVIEGSSSGEMSLMRQVGDINVDGFDDWVLGMSASSQYVAAGGVGYILYDGPYFWGQWWDTLGYPISINPHQDIDISSKTVQFKSENNNYRIGHDVSGAGDINGDGIQDIAISTINYNGAVHFFMGGGQ